MDIATRAPIAGPTFIRLLARVVDAEAAPSGIAPSQRLGRWIDWNRAVALSHALERPPEALPATPSGGDPDEDATRARRALAGRIGDHEAWDKAMPDDAADAVAGLRRHYAALQHAMQADAGRLRGVLRDRLAAGTPAQARLAGLDAVMERVATPREHGLLAALPGLLGDRYADLHRRAHAGRDADDLLAPVARAGDAWRSTFRKDLQDLLLAELDLRFLPIDGLLAALRTH